MVDWRLQLRLHSRQLSASENSYFSLWNVSYGRPAQKCKKYATQEYEAIRIQGYFRDYNLKDIILQFKPQYLV